ncbi:MAG: hypothetical protein M1829_005215 [Trizodia sp. TS-e1964]|nr:MAG: hypothetical protein M1829_005215 [Trizodia sp. TS-e1964]
MASNGVSLAIPAPYEENGRLYHGYHKGMYMYPCDEEEKDRMDIGHKFFQVARRNSLHSAQIHVRNAKILDIGTGTGIWAIDMADKYLESTVIGLDLSLIQPEKIPPNLRFRILNFEDHWNFGFDAWDLLHFRLGCGSVNSWPEIYDRIFQHLKPGIGSFEQVEIDYTPRSDDNSLPQDGALCTWWSYLKDATERACRPLAYQGSSRTRAMLDQAGFSDIQEMIIKAPLNPWPTNLHEKEVGRWYSIFLNEGLEALSMAAFTRVYRWSQADVVRLTAEARKEIINKRIHAYNNM